MKTPPTAPSDAIGFVPAFFNQQLSTSGIIQSKKINSSISENPMKTNKINSKAIMTTLRNNILILLLGMLLTLQARAQIYVSDYASGTVGEYNLNGTPINASLISGLAQPSGLAVSANLLYVIVHDGTNGIVQVYDAISGAVVNPSLVTAPQYPEVLALAGNNLYVVSPGASGEGSGLVGLYDATTGAPIVAPLLPSLVYPSGIAIYGNRLYVPQQENLIFGYINVYNATTGSPIAYQFVPNLLHAPSGLLLAGPYLFEANGGDGTIGKYAARTGATINAAFISGLNVPNQMALVGKSLFVTNSGDGTVREYDAITGAVIKPAFISRLTQPFGIAIRHPHSGTD